MSPRSRRRRSAENAAEPKTLHERIGHIEVQIAGMATDLRWLKRVLPILVGAIVSPKVGGPDLGQAVGSVVQHVFS